MIRFLVFTIFLFSISTSYATAVGDSIKPVEKSLQYDEFWKTKRVVGVNISEMAFVNWTSGGNNSITTLLNAEINNRYKDAYYSWTNKAALRYGINAQEGRELRKTEDELLLSSTFGYRKDSLSNWYYSAKATFNSQFSNGYRYPDTEIPISRFMAPAYLFIGIGTEYASEDGVWNFYISPITEKSTFVLDQRLANEGRYGVTGAIKDEEGNIIREGENARSEFGFLFTSQYTNEVFENIHLDNRLSLYSDYLNNFGNIDVDWQFDVNLVVNQYIKANIGAHIRYDDDVKFQEDTDGDGELESFGPRLQLKQLLGVGVVYTF